MAPSMNDEQAPTHVVMLGSTPLAASESLDAAKADAFAREAARMDRAVEYHWSEHAPGEWRLTARPEGRNRFSWTQYRVVTVPSVVGGAA